MRAFWWMMIFVAQLNGCSHPDYAIPLPRGYELVRGNDVDVFIASKDQSVVIGGTITGYAVLAERYVVGREDTTEVKRKAPQGFPVGKGGWFVLDTQTRTAQTELSESDWNEKVKQINDGKIPKLRVPD